MAKSLNQLTNDLREYIIELNSDAHNRGYFRSEKYHNLKLEIDTSNENNPVLVITVGMLKGVYSINTLEKVSGSLGADEKYVRKWFGKTGIAENIKIAWKVYMESPENTNKSSKKERI